jgi:hypothetical protein
VPDPHVKKTGPRKGWFAKASGGNGRKTRAYKTECKNGKRGYIGPRYEAHHVIPQTCIEESIDEVVANGDRDADYIEAIQYLTEWDINAKINMIGLPHVTAYMLLYQSSETLKSIGAGSLPWVNAFNGYRKASRARWQAEIKANPPRDLPIHQPVCWGHTVYNTKVQAKLVKVWQGMNVRRKKHDLTAKDLAQDLNTVADDTAAKLEERGSTNQKSWNDLLAGKAHNSFCMVNLPTSPL